MATRHGVWGGARGPSRPPVPAGLSAPAGTTRRSPSWDVPSLKFRHHRAGPPSIGRAPSAPSNRLNPNSSPTRHTTGAHRSDPGPRSLDSAALRVTVGHAPARRIAAGGTTGVVVVVGSVLLLALHVFLVRDVSVPSVVPDEAGYLGNARWLSGTSPTGSWARRRTTASGTRWCWRRSSRYPRPVHALSGRDRRQRSAGHVLFPLLYVFCRRLLGATERVALVAALVGALVPAATAYTTGRAWPRWSCSRSWSPPRSPAEPRGLRAEWAGWLFPVVVRAPPSDALPLHAPRAPWPHWCSSSPGGPGSCPCGGGPVSSPRSGS